MNNPWIQGIGIGLILLIIGALWNWIARRWSKNYLFDLRFEKARDPVQITSKRADIISGRSVLSMLISPRRGGSLRNCDVEFITRRIPIPFVWRWIKPIGSDVIRIEAGSAPHWKKEAILSWNNTRTGGIEVEPSSPLTVVEQKATRLYLAINARKLGSGFISFRGELNNGRGFGRRKVKIIPPTPGKMFSFPDEDLFTQITKEWEEFSEDPTPLRPEVKPQLSFQFSTGDGDHQFMSITNHGSDRRFWAEAVVIHHRDPVAIGLLSTEFFDDFIRQPI